LFVNSAIVLYHYTCIDNVVILVNFVEDEKRGHNITMLKVEWINNSFSIPTCVLSHDNALQYIM